MELEELRARPALLGACMVCPTLRGELEQLKVDFEVLLAPTDTCENCLTLRMQLVDRDATIRKLEKAAPVFPSLDCDTCAAQTMVLEDLREKVLSLRDDNNRLREVLSWVYARQPQLEMIIDTKRAEGEMSGVGFGECSNLGEKSAPVKIKTAPIQPGETVDGVYNEPPKAAPKKQYWTPKPSQDKLDRIIEEELKPKGKKLVQQPEPPKATPPKPKSQSNPVPRRHVYHCEFCQRNGHLEEFCFRRKRGVGKILPTAVRGETALLVVRVEAVFKTVLLVVRDAFLAELLVIFSTAMDLVIEDLRELSRVHALEAVDRGMEDVWIMDSGCSRHMTGHSKWFSSFNPVSTKEYITSHSGTMVKLFLREVAFVRNLGFNLVSVSQLLDEGFEVHFKKGACCVLDAKETLVCSLLPFGQVFRVNLTSVFGPARYLVASPSADIWKWHRRLGHLRFDLLVRLSSMGLIRGLLKLRAEKDLVCHPYHHGKMVAASHIPVSQVMTSYLGELLHMDTVGPARVASISGKWYVLVVVDDFSRFSWVFFMEFKDEAFGFVRDLVLRLRNESHKAMRAIRSDNGGEFRNSRFKNFCGDLVFFSIYPSQNGVVECKNRTLVEMARTMLDEHRSPRRFWAEAVNTACYIANRIFLRAFLGKTSYDLRFGRQPSIKHLQAFGCRCFVLKKVGHLGKFESRCLDGIFLGYASSSRAFRVWILEAKQVVETCDNEEGTPIFEDEEGAVDDGDAGATAPAAAPAPSATISDDDGGPLPMTSSLLPRLQARAEAGSAEDAGKPPPNCRPIGTKWVLKNKQSESGMVVRNKGFCKKEGIDYGETLAPVARLEAIRILLAFAASKGFKLQQMDVKSAFLNGFIEEEVYVGQRPGFESARFPDRVYKLRKALYGLKQAPRAWYARLKSFKSGFVMGSVDKTLFLLSRGGDTTIVRIYVDDIIFGGSSHDLVSSFALHSWVSFEFFLGLLLKEPPSIKPSIQETYSRTHDDSYEYKHGAYADKDGKAVDQKEFRGMIGSLCARRQPDRTFSSRSAFVRATRLLLGLLTVNRYLKFTSELGLWYSSDADHAGCRIDRKSTSGTCQLLGTSLVSWSSRKQAKVSLSTTKDIGEISALAKNPVLHSRTKHIDVKGVDNALIKGEIESQWTGLIALLV
ncbi:hypothetical protein U9M48_013196 [Paspalum notatum var. saurae]|uniref:Integrase catalytic domain-containing protein n=1 Tax=Paspalum notatum var. saurae TaxID=547442 RepID=A0AAQ3SZ08_PASNO